MGRSVTLTGIDPKTYADARYYDTGGYLYLKYDLYDIGDTVLKDKRTFYVKIKKKNKIYLVSLNCSNLNVDSVLYNPNSALKKN